MSDDLRDRDHPELRCPTCSEGWLVAGEKNIDPSKPAWRRFDCGHFVDDRARLYAMARPDLRQRYADTISAVLGKPNGSAYQGTLPAALLAVRDEEMETLRARLLDYENTLSWETSCLNCAAILDASVKETERAETAEAEVESLRERIASSERALNRVISLAKSMREWCSPHGVATDYADRIAEAVIGSEQAMKRGEAFFILEAVERAAKGEG